eukprot:365090-Chlamydomonas_euryale.AAC.1
MARASTDVTVLFGDCAAAANSWPAIQQAGPRPFEIARRVAPDVYAEGAVLSTVRVCIWRGHFRAVGSHLNSALHTCTTWPPCCQQARALDPR